jgi:hypothetical protein
MLCWGFVFLGTGVSRFAADFKVGPPWGLMVAAVDWFVWLLQVSEAFDEIASGQRRRFDCEEVYTGVIKFSFFIVCCAAAFTELY